MTPSDLLKSRILIVDDHQANIDVLESFLMMEGYEDYRSTTDPREVVDLFGTYNPDLILLDLMMPHLSGFDVMKQLKSLVSEKTFLPILVLTADANPASKQKALSEGATDFLTKPFDLIEVGLRIHNLLFTKQLHNDLLNSNLVLEQRVKDRTKDLQLMNDELIKAKEKAEASNRLKTSFINNISHEIRTPLNGILGFGSFLAEEDLEPEERMRFLGMVNESSERLLNTVTNFMDISMLSSGTKEVYKTEFDFGSLLTGVAERTEKACRSKGLDFIWSCELTESERIVYSDRDMVLKILQHLTDNAVKFTSTGSVELKCRLKGYQLMIAIKDTGRGIHENARSAIFENFIQEDNSDTRGFEGTGLGLSISLGFTKLLKGSLTVESEPNKGSEFFLTLPVGKDDQSADQTEPAGTDDQVCLLLIAEDDELNAQYLEHMLNAPNMVKLFARNGAEAEAVFLENPGIRAVLMDLKMPVVDGFEATRRIKKLNPSVPVVVISAYAGSEERDKAFEAGCDDMIIKPVIRDILIGKLAKYGIPVSH